MASETNATRPYFQIHLTCLDSQYPEANQVSTFIYNLHLLYTILRLATDETYSYVSLSRPGYRLRKLDRLRVKSIALASPLDVKLIGELTVGAVGAVSTFSAMLQGVYKIRADRRKVEAETRKLLAEARKADAEVDKIHAETDKIHDENEKARQLPSESASLPVLDMASNANEAFQIRELRELLNGEADVIQVLKSRGAVRSCVRVLRTLDRSDFRVQTLEITVVELRDNLEG